MDDELFGDLLGPKPGSSVSSKAPALAPASSSKGTYDLYSKIKPMNGAEDEGSSSAPGLALGVTEANKMSVSLTAEELSALVDKGVQSALESTFSKFVRSLRTVLEDMTRRLSSQEATVVELRAAVSDLREVVQSQPYDMHLRFTSLDMAVKDVERGVQALRDRQELQEAQDLLARMSSDASRSKSAATAASAAAAASPVEATATAPSAPSPSPSPAPAVPAPAPAPAAPPTAPAAAAPVGPQAPAAAPALPAPQQPPYGMPLHAPPAQQMPPPTHMGGYGVPSPMGMMPGAPPLPTQPAAEPSQQAPQQLQQQPQQQAQQQQQQQPQQQPQQQLHQPHQSQQQSMPQYPYQPQQQVGGMQPAGGMSHPPEAGPYGGPPQQQQQQQPLMHASHAQAAYAPPYGAMSVMEAPRAPAMPPHGMPPLQTAPLPGHPGPPRMDLPAGPPPPQMVNYPSPSSGMHAYPPPASVPGVSVPSMYGRATAPPPSYRASAPPPSSGGGGGGGPTGSRAVPLDKIIADISQMGFSRGDVLTAVNSLQSSGKALDLNTIIDKLTRGI